MKDTKNAKTYLKLVNALPSALQIDVKGVALPSAPKWEGFSGAPTDKTVMRYHPDDDHSGETLVVNGSVLTLPPYSVRVIEL